jgi:hypothetical protein
MHKIRENAVKELQEYEQMGLNSNNLPTVCKLVKLVKDIDTVNAMEEAKYSNRGSYDGSYNMSYDSIYRNGYIDESNAVDRRGRNADGSYRMRNDGGRDQRYSYGYSRDLKEDLEHLMHKTHDTREKEMLERFMKEL